MLHSRLLASFLIFGATVSAGNLPRRAPDFSMSLADGSKVSLSRYRGKVVLMAFILTTCSHCQAATGLFKQMQTSLGASGFQVLESAVEDDSQKHVAEFIDKFKPNFPVGWSERPDVAPVLQPDDKLHIMPQCVLIDRKGIIRVQFYGDDAMFEGDGIKKLTAMVAPYLK